jgi:class 3 adenylate cyclase
VVTFLFTDVEGSTRRWESDAEGMWAALAAHDEVLRRAIETHGGWLFKHTGDGVCAAFGSPRSAVDAAVAAQRALELPVRMGIATGEAELRGADYFGAVLNRAARVMAAGHGGQILLAESTACLLRDAANAGGAVVALRTATVLLLLFIRRRPQMPWIHAQLVVAAVIHIQLPQPLVLVWALISPSFSGARVAASPRGWVPTRQRRTTKES